MRKRKKTTYTKQEREQKFTQNLIIKILKEESEGITERQIASNHDISLSYVSSVIINHGRKKRNFKHSEDLKDNLCKKVLLPAIFKKKKLVSSYQEYLKIQEDTQPLHTVKNYTLVLKYFKKKYNCIPSQFKNFVPSTLLTYLLENNTNLNSEDELSSVIKEIKTQFDLPDGKLFIFFRNKYGFLPHEAKAKIVDFLYNKLKEGLSPEEASQEAKVKFNILLDETRLLECLNVWYKDVYQYDMIADYDLFFGPDSEEEDTHTITGTIPPEGMDIEAAD